ncbi:MAG: hypothetical protein M1819_004089 [Sarea resinae]|nr:MAG: hypothetical protein M1819_004089 [Sarea resinae]
MILPTVGHNDQLSSPRFSCWFVLCVITVVLLLSVDASFARPEDVAKRRQLDTLEDGPGPIYDSESDSDTFASAQQLPLGQLDSHDSERSRAELKEAHGAENDGHFGTISTLPALVRALDVMQSHYFEIWQGSWPDAIDWTAAVLGTYVSAALFTLSTTLEYVVPSTASGGVSSLNAEAQAHENLVSRHFTQLTAFYFGENDFSLRNQAYDDMLWVVLGWLENIKFINLHNSLHYSSAEMKLYNSSTWYGSQFISSFAHRARLFYDLASHGWDTSLCGGGMVWSPYLTPYKNAITNELFIAASISMYLHFPGDDNPSPFSTGPTSESLKPAKPHDPKYLKAAVDGYMWLSTSNMTNDRGLFIDGFHIHRWGRNGSTGTGKCDVRNEMVYTYNQGVLLSGLRGLWEGTGARSYLEDGHALVRNVISATAWSLDDDADPDKQKTDKWAGLGRNGILEEVCDATGSCSQNAQTFKGIFFHHLTLFCHPLPEYSIDLGISHAADKDLIRLHDRSCAEYAPWVTHNAQAALKTQDRNGEFGTWWGAHEGHGKSQQKEDSEMPKGSIDYRNLGVPEDLEWRVEMDDRVRSSEDLMGTAMGIDSDSSSPSPSGASVAEDLNDRGRGRTVETQGGGVSVLRAMWEIADSRGRGS